MKTDLTDITLVVDRSGSMASCQAEAQSGINAFIKDQKEKPGDAIFSLLQFDTEHEYVFNAVPIKQVEKYALVPRGMTALLDAVGKAITETGSRLDKMPEVDRPGLVVVAIITDGQENASNEYKRSKIKEMIEHQQSVYGWQFTFLGANQDAFAEAGSIGINFNATANYAADKSVLMYSGLSKNVNRMRHDTSVGSAVNCSYTSDERNDMEAK